MLLLVFLLNWHTFRSLAWPVHKAEILEVEKDAYIVNTQHGGTVNRINYSISIKYAYDNQIYYNMLYTDSAVYFPGGEYLSIRINPYNPEEISYAASRWDMILIFAVLGLTLIVGGIINVLKQN